MFFPSLQHLFDGQAQNLKLSLQTCPNCPGANPTGTVLPADRRRRIYELCSKYNLLILEGKIVFRILILISPLIL